MNEAENEVRETYPKAKQDERDSVAEQGDHTIVVGAHAVLSDAVP
jgi:hypothetical protein